MKRTHEILSAFVVVSFRTLKSIPSTELTSSTCCKPSTRTASLRSSPSPPPSSNWCWTPSSGPSNTPWGMLLTPVMTLGPTYPVKMSPGKNAVRWHSHKCEHMETIDHSSLAHLQRMTVRRLCWRRVSFEIAPCNCFVCWPGLQILYTMLQNVAQEEAAAQSFYQTYFCDILQHIFSVVTDTSHTAGEFARSIATALMEWNNLPINCDRD